MKERAEKNKRTSIASGKSTDCLGSITGCLFLHILSHIVLKSVELAWFCERFKSAQNITFWTKLRVFQLLSYHMFPAINALIHKVIRGKEHK